MRRSVCANACDGSRVTGEGNTGLVELRKAWRDGTTHLLFEPVEFLEKLAALTPRPEVHVLLTALRRLAYRHNFTEPQDLDGNLVVPTKVQKPTL
jgi:hypothetical protein